MEINSEEDLCTACNKQNCTDIDSLYNQDWMGNENLHEVFDSITGPYNNSIKQFCEDYYMNKNNDTRVVSKDQTEDQSDEDTNVDIFMQWGLMIVFIGLLFWFVFPFL